MTVRVRAADVEIAAGDVYVAPGERGKLASTISLFSAQEREN
jgi:hypothetical protein